MTSSNSLESTINQAWEDRAQLSPTSASKEVLEAVEHVINELNTGRLRVSTKQAVGQWVVDPLLADRHLESAVLDRNSMDNLDEAPSVLVEVLVALVA